MKLPPDVIAFVYTHFPDEEREAAIATLSAACIHTGEPPGDRLFRCTVMASNGDLTRLQYYAGLLAIDWRDVIVAGEYEVQGHGLVRVRDLSEPIPAQKLIMADNE